MACRDVQAKLFEYLDGELPEREREAVEQHLPRCPECRAAAGLEETFRGRYLAPLRPLPAPARLREHVVRLLDALPAADGNRGRPRLPFPGTVVLTVAAAALLLVVLGGLIGAVIERGLTARSFSLTALAEASVGQHRRLTQGVLPHDISEVSPRAAEQWFKQRLAFNVSLPELPSDRLSFVGGRISHLRDLEVAAVHYRMDGHDVSLFVIPPERFRQLWLPDTPKFKIVTYNGYDVIVWASHGTGYTLVSEIGGKSCLVCHVLEDGLGLTALPTTHR